MVREGLLLLSIGIAGCIHGAINAPQVPTSFKKQQDRPSGFELFMKRIGCTSEKDAIEDEGRQGLPRFARIQMPGSREHAREDASNPRRFELRWWRQTQLVLQSQGLLRQGIPRRQSSEDLLCLGELTIQGPGQPQHVRAV